jgi:hypothetical protein
VSNFSVEVFWMNLKDNLDPGKYPLAMPNTRDIDALFAMYKASIRGPDEQVLARAFIHAVHGTIEGLLFYYEWVLLCHDDMRRRSGIEPRLTDADRLCLRNERVHLADDGGTKIKDLNPSFWARFNLVISAMLKLLGKARAKRETDDPGKVYVLSRENGLVIDQARGIRNRLTHPRGVGSLLVSSADVNLTFAALDAIGRATSLCGSLLPTIDKYEPETTDGEGEGAR